MLTSGRPLSDAPLLRPFGLLWSETSSSTGVVDVCAIEALLLIIWMLSARTQQLLGMRAGHLRERVRYWRSQAFESGLAC